MPHFWEKKKEGGKKKKRSLEKNITSRAEVSIQFHPFGAENPLQRHMAGGRG